MKALSVDSDFAALIAAGEKTIECRTWKTSYRGELLICSNRLVVPGTIPRHAIAVCYLKNVREFQKADIDAACLERGDFQKGLYAWELDPICSVIPFQVRGMPGLFDVDDSLISRIDDAFLSEEEMDAIIEKYFTPLLSV